MSQMSQNGHQLIMTLTCLAFASCLLVTVLRQWHATRPQMFQQGVLIMDLKPGCACSFVGATNKALAKAKRRAAEDALRISAEKEAIMAAAEVAKQASQLQTAIGTPSVQQLAIDSTSVPANSL